MSNCSRFNIQACFHILFTDLHYKFQNVKSKCEAQWFVSIQIVGHTPFWCYGLVFQFQTGFYGAYFSPRCNGIFPQKF